jgi:modification methylase
MLRIPVEDAELGPVLSQCAKAEPGARQIPERRGAQIDCRVALASTPGAGEWTSLYRGSRRVASPTVSERCTVAARFSTFQVQGFFLTGTDKLTNERKTADLPLAVWPCAQRTSQWQRHKRYVSESNRHPGKMLPALAQRAVEAYSDPGDLVVDPMCGIGTTLVEASDLGRRAVGIELEARWAKLASANLDQLHAGRRTRSLALVTEGDARKLPRVLTTQAAGLLKRERDGAQPIGAGAVDLILTSPPYACEVADINEVSGPGPLRRDDTTNYSSDRCNLGHARGAAYLAAMADIYRSCAAVLRPDGFMVCVTKDMRSAGGGALRNLSCETIALCEDAGLLYWQRVIGLLATVRDSELVMRPSFWQTLHARRRRAKGDRTQVVAHEDVLVFRKPLVAVAKASAAPIRKAA